MDEAPATVILNADTSEGTRSIAISNGVIVDSLHSDADRVFDANGGALLPGLHDHHLHLHSMAGRLQSLDLDSEEIQSQEGLLAAIDRAPGEEWIRVVGYDDHLLGRIDRDLLDSARTHRPIRVQHRSGLAWILNSQGLRLVADEEDEGAALKIERDEEGRWTGWVFGQDIELRRRIGGEWPSLDEVGRRLLRLGITSVTDATPTNGQGEIRAFAKALQTGLFPSVTAMGGKQLEADAALASGITSGPVKLVVGEDLAPGFDRLVRDIEEAHGAERATAIHCVSHEALTLAIAAWRRSGVRLGDRVEHGSVIVPEMIQQLGELGLQVVTQPCFIHQFGDRYMNTIPEEQWDNLYRIGSLIKAGVHTKAGSDAPFGNADPWRAMNAAVQRRTQTGRLLGRGEKVSPESALGLYRNTEHQQIAGETPRADFVILNRPWRDARVALGSDLVAAVVVRGRLIEVGDLD